MRSCANSASSDLSDGDIAESDWDRRRLRRVVGYFRPHGRRMVLVLALMAAGAVLALVPALVTKVLLDQLAKPNSSFSYIIIVVTTGVAAGMIGGVVTYAQAGLETSISQDVMLELRRQLHDRLLDQTVDFFTQRQAGDVISRITNDVQRIGDIVEDNLSGAASNVFILPVTIAFMFFLSWRLTVMIPVLVLPWVVASSRRVEQPTYLARAQTQEQQGRLTAYLHEVFGISGILLVKAFVKQGAERLRFRYLSSELRRKELHAAKIQRTVDLLNALLLAAAPAAFWAYGAYLVHRGLTTLGTLVAFVVVLTGRLAMSVEDLASIHVKLAGSMALFQRLFDVIDLAAEITDAPNARALTRCRGAVGFENVTFTYQGAHRPALDDVSFRVEPGQLAALVGPTGAGKSTAAYLVPRFHDPQRGRVLIDGNDVRELSIESLGSHIGVVFQDSFFFNASIGDNLRYACPDASEDQLAAAAKAAYLHDFIVSLPDGYDTLVGERGHRLSGGEKQRLAIARVILKNPRIVVLDEATSHLDAVSEHLVQAALAPLLRDRTSLVIAHRLSTILAADLILVFDDGRVVEQGTHAQLVARRGLYSRLYERQFMTQTRAAAPSA